VYEERRVCSKCGNTQEKRVVNFGQSVRPLVKGSDSLQNAFTRAMTAESLISNDDPDGDRKKHNHVHCEACKRKPVNLNSTMRIQSAPEYMCIHVNLFARTLTGRPVKNRNSMDIPDILDLTEHVQTVGDHPAAPLRYKLIDIVYHSGTELGHGHYTAGVTGPGPVKNTDPANPLNQFFVNDSRVRPWSNATQTNVLTANPAKETYDPYLLFYEYIPVRSKGVGATTVGAINDESSIAERVRGRRRNRDNKVEDPAREAKEARGEE
jgi:ubiquitin C-terminal hydrolase